MLKNVTKYGQITCLLCKHHKPDNGFCAKARLFIWQTPDQDIVRNANYIHYVVPGVIECPEYTYDKSVKSLYTLCKVLDNANFPLYVISGTKRIKLNDK